MPHVDTLRAAYAAFAAGDLPGVLAALDPQIEWHVPTVLPHGGDFHGHDGVIGYFTGLAAHLREPVLELDAVVEAGERVIVTGVVSGVLDGEPASYGFAHSWAFRDGRAARFVEYVDVAAAVPAAAA
jgi:ketosteroid isomerase-like protein